MKTKLNLAGKSQFMALFPSLLPLSLGVLLRHRIVVLLHLSLAKETLPHVAKGDRAPLTTGEAVWARPIPLNNYARSIPILYGQMGKTGVQMREVFLEWISLGRKTFLLCRLLTPGPCYSKNSQWIGTSKDRGHCLDPGWGCTDLTRICWPEGKAPRVHQDEVLNSKGEQRRRSSPRANQKRMITG